MQRIKTGGAQPPAAAPPPAGVLSPSAGVLAALERHRSFPQMLLRDGSMAAAGLSSLHLGLGGSQDLGALLDASLIQHMQSLPRLELDSLLTSPKWKALLCWEEAEAAAFSGAQGSPTGHLEAGTNSAAPSSSALPSHFGFGRSESGAPVSPGVDQQVSASALAAAWAETQQQQYQQYRQPQYQQYQPAGQGDAVMMPVAQGVLSELPAALPLTRPRLGGAGKKRPSDVAHFGQLPGSPMSAPPPAKQLRQGAAASGGQLSGLASISDAMELDAQAAAEDAAASAAAFDAAAGQHDNGSAMDVITGLGTRLRLDSIGGPAEQRRLGAVAASVTRPPSLRPAHRVRRGSSAVAMLMADMPTSPTTGAQLLPMAQGEEGTVPAHLPTAASPAAHAGAPAVHSMHSMAGKGMTGMVVRVAVKAEAAPDATAAAGAYPPASQQPFRRQVLPTKSHKAVATGESGVFTSAYRGVTKHKLTGRFEAHFWDSSFIRPNQKKGKRSKGRQVYLGGYETELEAARAYDRAVLAYLGQQAPLNFCVEDYGEDLAWMAGRAPEEVVSVLRRGSVGFARGQSQYRGVTRHHQQGKWEARIGRVQGSKYLYLGTFDSAEEAARAYDRACVKYRGTKAILNFTLADYQEILNDPDSYDILPSPAGAPANGAIGQVSMPGQHPGTPAGGHLMGAESAGMYLPMMSPPQQQAQQGVQQYHGQQYHGQYSLPMLSPLSMAASPQQPNALLPAHGSAFNLVGAAGTAGEAQQPQGMRLPAIRTRARLAAVAAATGSTPRVGGSAGGGGSGTPSTGGSAGSDPLADFLLSPLAASLLSPLGLSGSPAGWRDSPLGKLATGELARLLSGSGSATPLSSLLSPGKHRLAGASGAAPVPPLEPGAAPSGSFGGLEGIARLFSTPTSEADLFLALQWLDKLDTMDPAQLEAILASPMMRDATAGAPAPASTGSANQGGGGAAGLGGMPGSRQA